MAYVNDHEILPQRGTMRRERDGLPSENPVMPMPWEYPLTATCAVCGQSIRRERSMLSDWEHVIEITTVRELAP